MTKEKVFYPNLNALRFIAASAVVFYHTEQVKRHFYLPNIYETKYMFLVGKLGVCLFFCLSGFLITSLLIKEKEKYGFIAIKQFYLRRIFRIWPLYFLVAGIGLYIMPFFPQLMFSGWINPYEHLLPVTLLAFLFLPNLLQQTVGTVPYVGQIWSIGAEEQFYAFWPFVVNYCKSTRALKHFVIGFIVVFISIRLSCIALFSFTHKSIFDNIDYFLGMRMPLDCMAIGSLFALINLNERAKVYITSRKIQIVNFILIAALFTTGYGFKNFFWDIYGVLFSLMILNLVNSTSILNMENKYMSYLGKLSYGMYMWQYFPIFLITAYLTHNSLLIYLLGFGLTIGISALSYEFFESPFLKIKERFAKIKSGSSANTTAESVKQTTRQVNKAFRVFSPK